MLQLGIIAASLSIDALGVGFSYRMRGVKITGRAKGIIAVLTSVAMGVSMLAGRLLAALLPTEVMNLFGTALLALIGLGMIRNACFGEEACYDFNKSKTIELGEAVALGLALSADAASCGLALSAVIEKSLWLPVLCGLMQGGFLRLGELLFEKGIKTRINGQKGMGIFAGGILVLIALMKLQ